MSGLACNTYSRGQDGRIRKIVVGEEFPPSGIAVRAGYGEEVEVRGGIRAAHGDAVHCFGN